MASILRFVVKRVIASILVMYIIVTVVFFMAHASPYNPLTLLLGRHATVQNLNRLRRLYGFNLPVWQQYVNYMGGLLHGNLGYSYSSSTLGEPVWAILQNGIPVTLKLGAMALALSLIVGLPMGLLTALKQNSIIDYGGQGLMILLYVIPAFVLIPFCQILFGVRLHWLPVIGWGSPGIEGYKEMVLPVSIYAAGIAGFFAKSFRSFVLEIMRQDYIRTARAKGLKSRVVIYLHMAKNTLIPLASIVGPTVAFLIVGAFIIEVLFSIPGVGYLTAQSVINSDYSVIVGTTLILIGFVVVVNMLTDIFYAIVDPRVRL